LEAIEAAEAEAPVKAIEAAEAIEAVAEGPWPRAEGAAEEPLVEAGSETAVEARVAPVKTRPSGVNLAGGPQHYQERQGPNTEQ
jgi:hypothetical protein